MAARNSTAIDGRTVLALLVVVGVILLLAIDTVADALVSLLVQAGFPAESAGTMGAAVFAGLVILLVVKAMDALGGR